MSVLAGMMAGFFAWFVVRYVIGGIYTVDQNERAIKTVFGRAQRLGTATVTDGELGKGFDDDERQRYAFPQVRVIPDFRAPDNIRLGIAPLYTSYTDIYRAMRRIKEIVVQGEHLVYSTAHTAVT